MVIDHRLLSIRSSSAIGISGALMVIDHRLLSIRSAGFFAAAVDGNGNPHFPALRSGPTAALGASLQKQIPSSKRNIPISAIFFFSPNV